MGRFLSTPSADGVTLTVIPLPHAFVNLPLSSRYGFVFKFLITRLHGSKRRSLNFQPGQIVVSMSCYQISPTAWRHILLNGHYTFWISRNVLAGRYFENKCFRSQRSCRRPYPAPNSTKRTCANQLNNTQRLKISSTMNGTDRKKPLCIGWCKNTSELSLHRLRQKPVQGYLTLLKTNLRHFLNVAFWPMGSYACVVPAAPMRNW